MRFDDAPRVAGVPVSLRPLEERDVDPWYAYLGDPAVVAHTSWSLGGRAELAAIVDDCGSDGQRSTARFAIVDADDRLVGTIGLVGIVWRFRTAELAYDIAPSHAGRGVATACARAVSDWLIVEQRFIRVEATTLDTNAASRRVLEKAGFVHEGLMRSKKLVRDEPRDFDLFAKVRRGSA